LEGMMPQGPEGMEGPFAHGSQQGPQRMFSQGPQRTAGMSSELSEMSSQPRMFDLQSHGIQSQQRPQHGVSSMIKDIIEARLIESIEAKLQARRHEQQLSSSEEASSDSSTDASSDSSSQDSSSQSGSSEESFETAPMGNIMQQVVAEQIQEQMLFGRERGMRLPEMFLESSEAIESSESQESSIDSSETSSDFYSAEQASVEMSNPFTLPNFEIQPSFHMGNGKGYQPSEQVQYRSAP